jgi:hypothetical protein
MSIKTHSIAIRDSVSSETKYTGDVCDIHSYLLDNCLKAVLVLVLLEMCDQLLLLMDALPFFRAVSVDEPPDTLTVVQMPECNSKLSICIDSCAKRRLRALWLLAYSSRSFHMFLKGWSSAS